MVERDVAVERPALDAGLIERNRRDVLSAPQQVDLDDVDLAREQLVLLADIAGAPVSTGRLVREAEDSQ